MDNPPPYSPSGSYNSARSGPSVSEDSSTTDVKRQNEDHDKMPPPYRGHGSKSSLKGEVSSPSKVDLVHGIVTDLCNASLSSTRVDATIVLIFQDQIRGEICGELVGWPTNDTPKVQPLPCEAGSRDFWSRTDIQSRLEVKNLQYYRPLVGHPSELDIEEMSTVRVEEVYFRTENDFGLFETLTFKALVVKVDMGPRSDVVPHLYGGDETELNRQLAGPSHRRRR